MKRVGDMDETLYFFDKKRSAVFCFFVEEGYLLWKEFVYRSARLASTDMAKAVACLMKLLLVRI